MVTWIRSLLGSQTKTKKSRFDTCLTIVLEHEGGYVNHPQDPGGETNLGVTKRVYQEFGGTKDMRDLTVEDVTPIYKTNYWDKVRGDDLPAGLDLMVFDFGVNAGPNKAIKYLQRMVGTPADGIIGPMTLTAVTAYVHKHGIEHALETYAKSRLGFYQLLKTFPTFGRGWTKRVEKVLKQSKKHI